MPHSNLRSIIRGVIYASLLFSFWGLIQGQSLSLDSTQLADLQYRHIGPMGNRISAVVGIAGNPKVYLVGAASGGIFRTTDGGVSWDPVFDDQAVASIGSLAIAPSDPNVIWAGTGETFIRSNVSVGNGIYKSTDGGKTWQHMGLEKSGRIGRIVIDPRDPDVVLAAVMGHCYGPQRERGVFRTADAGQTWQHVLFVDENTGASDLVMDPNNPRILLAGTWQMVIWTWGRQSGGPGSGIFMSRDGGLSWTRLSGRGLPRPPWGKIGLAMSPADSQKIYALIETNSNRDFAELDEHQGVLWRSDDGGSTWDLINSSHQLVQRPNYYTRAAVAPDDPNEIRFMSLRHTLSIDGGKTVSRVESGGDHHDIWIDPSNGDRMIVGHDQGVSISTTRGKSWFRPQLPVAQMYHVFTDNQIPYFVYGNRQDGPSARGPSNSLTRGPIPIGAWHAVGGCESGFAIPDPADNNIVWSGCYDGILERYDLRTGHSRDVSVWPEALESWPAAPLKYRFQWTFPVSISPHDSNRVYVGSQYVHVTSNQGQSYQVISPDLTTNEKRRQQKFGGLTPDDAGPTIAPVVFAIAESPLEAGLIWAGTNDGLVQLTRDGGRSWTNLTSRLPGIPSWGTISNIEPSRHNAGTAYLSVDGHQINDTRPYIYRTTDYGNSWERISEDIPTSSHSYVHIVREDPVRPGMLYAGTENALYVSWDEGSSWHSLQTNLPHAPVHWLTIQEHFNDLVVATYGRGFWILDDVTPLQRLTPEALESEVHFFQPREAYRFRFREPSMSQPGDPAAGQNPAYGASLHYYLSQNTEASVSMEICDAGGKLVRTLEDLDKGAGIQRVIWDLRFDAVRKPKLRTSPIEHSHVVIPDQGWRPLEEVGKVAVLASPGTYTATLKVGQQELRQTVRVLKDPHSEGSEADIAAQMIVVEDLNALLNSAVDLIDEIEWIRRQIQDLEARLAETPDSAAIVESCRELDHQLQELEGNFFDLRLTGAGQDTLRWPRRLYSRLAHLLNAINQTDFRPTDQQLEVYRLLKQRLAEHQGGMQQLRQGAIEKFNKLLRREGIGNVISGR